MSWVTLGADGKIDVNFNDMTDPGTFNLALETYLLNYPFIETTSPFTIRLSSSKLTCQSVPPQTFYFGDDPLSFTIMHYNETILQ